MRVLLDADYRDLLLLRCHNLETRAFWQGGFRPLRIRPIGKTK